jgi:hypothetical protein
VVKAMQLGMTSASSSAADTASKLKAYVIVEIDEPGDLFDKAYKRFQIFFWPMPQRLCPPLLSFP